MVEEGRARENGHETADETAADQAAAGDTVVALPAAASGTVGGHLGPSTDEAGLAP